MMKAYDLIIIGGGPAGLLLLQETTVLKVF